MEPIIIEFTLQKDDISQAVRVNNLRKNPKIWWIALVIYLPVSVISFWLILTHGSLALNTLVVFLLLVAPGIVYKVIYKGVNQITDRLLLTNNRWEVTSDGVLVSITSKGVCLASDHLGWYTIERALVSPQHYFLARKEAEEEYRFLPRRALRQYGEEERFYRLLQEELGEVEVLRDSLSYRISLWLVFIIYLLNLGLLIYGYHYHLFAA